MRLLTLAKRRRTPTNMRLHPALCPELRPVPQRRPRRGLNRVGPQADACKASAILPIARARRYCAGCGCIACLRGREAAGAARCLLSSAELCQRTSLHGGAEGPRHPRRAVRVLGTGRRHTRINKRKGRRKAAESSSVWSARLGAAATLTQGRRRPCHSLAAICRTRCPLAFVFSFLLLGVLLLLLLLPVPRSV